MNKRRFLWLAAALVAFAAAGGGYYWWQESRHAEAGHVHAAKETRTKYNCAMHPTVIRDEPGQCPICAMDLVPMKQDSHAAGGGEKGGILYYRDPMHPWITSDKPGKSPDCGMDMVPVHAGEGNGSAIRIDPTVVQNMGVRTQKVDIKAMDKRIRTTGVLEADETRLHSVNAKVGGWVERLHVNFTGQPVRRGQLLMELYSPDLVATQEEYLQAYRYAAQLAGASEQARANARALLESARRRLLYWDIAPSVIQALEKKGSVSKTLPIVSPASGVVVAKNAVQGQNIMPGMEVYRLADLSTIWVQADLYQADLRHVEVGQEAEVEIAYLPGRSFEGKVSFVSPLLDPGSRTAKVRVEIENTPDLLLKPDMVATVRLNRPLEETVVVPDQSIIRSGERNIAVVALPNGYFEPREVKLGAESNGEVQVLEGLHPGETLVVSSQFLIDSESNLKAAIRSMTHDHGASMAGGEDAGASPPGEPDRRPDIELEDAAAAISPQFRQGMEAVMADYFELQEALASDDIEAAGAAAERMRRSLDAVDASMAPDEGAWEERKAELRAEIGKIISGGDWELRRTAFGRLSKALIATLERHGREGWDIHRFHCPMAMENRGGEWLQKHAEIRNPYMGEGSGMLSCGTPREIL